MARLTLDGFCLRCSGAIGLDNTAATEERLLMESLYNEAQEQFVLETQCKVSVADLNLTAGIGDYTLPTGILALRHGWIVHSDGTKTNLTPVYEDDINRLRAATTTSASPAALYAIAGHDRLMIYPDPASGDVLHVSYVPRPTTMSSGTDYPSSVPDEYHPVLEDYGKWKAADWDDDTTSKIGLQYQQNWLQGLALAKKNLRRKGGRRRPPATVLARKRTSAILRLRPDQDYR